MALILCAECGNQISDQAATCPICGFPSKLSSASRKPVVGLVLGGILGVVDLLWAVAQLRPGALDIVLYAAVPAFVPIAFAAASVNAIGNTCLLVGVGMTALDHRRGPTTVRVTCGLMVPATIALGIAAYFAIMKSVDSLSAEILAGLTGGVVGGVVGGLLGWVVVGFLFRRSRSW